MADGSNPSSTIQKLITPHDQYMVLLLKDLQNISSNNDLYSDKISDYAMSDLIWNQLLVGHLPNVDIKVLPTALQVDAISADEVGAFPKDQVEQRQRLFFEALKAIWEQV